ncbi:hypothetical protein TKK_0002391 [Trichogramma kaykai]
MPAAAATTAAAMANPEAALAELAIEPAPPEELDEPPEARPRAGSFSSRNGLMKPLVALAMPGMYLFDKYSQYRREQREMSRRKVTERELQHLHHKIVSFLFPFAYFIYIVHSEYDGCKPTRDARQMELK